MKEYDKIYLKANYIYIVIFTSLPLSDKFGRAYLAINIPQNTRLTIPENPRAYDKR